MRETFRGSMRAVRRGKGIIDIDVAEFGKRVDKSGVVLLLAFVKARIFQQQNVASAHFGDRSFCRFADAIRGEANRLAEVLGKHRRDGFQRICLVRAGFRAAEMGEQDDLAALIRDLADGRQEAVDARCIAYLAVFHGDIEVDAHENAFAPYVGVVERTETVLHRVISADADYTSFPIATAVSAMRFENPHSLSYHDMTRTRVPSSTFV